ncbi:MAG TPA: hypothetical protein PLI77_09825 [Bacteroidales bacterium]|nr:hypothetical protein [Bacteroidales bacterium]
MGTVKIKIFGLFFLIFFGSCSLIGIEHWFEAGKTDANGQYVPKRERYKLKDKPNNNIPINLDTVNIYKRIEMYQNGYMVYPTNNYYPENYSYYELQDIVSFIQFYPKGRCVSIVISAKGDDGLVNSLKRSDLNPNKPENNKSYYFSSDGEKIEIETFVYGYGYGDYVILDYYLNEPGDTLKMIYKNSVDVYIKEVLPTEWEKYNIDW